MNAEKYNLDRIYFGGCFIRGKHACSLMLETKRLKGLVACLRAGHAATIGTLSYAIRFWSKGTKRALFLRHEGFLCVVFYYAVNGLGADWIRAMTGGRLAHGSSMSRLPRLDLGCERGALCEGREVFLGI